MSDYAALLITALVALGCSLFLFLLLAGALAHYRWSREQKRRGAGYWR